MSDPQAVSRTFATALTAAVRARGLDVESLEGLLLRRGAAISATTLRAWQRGVQRPEWPESLPALTSLEYILRVGPGVLTSILSPWYDGQPAPWVVAADDEPPTVPGEVRPRQHDGSVRIIAADDEVTLGSGRYLTEVRTRIVAEAMTDGVDRHLAVDIPEDANMLQATRIVPVSRCRRGKVIVDAAANRVATELLLDNVYQKGETFTIEYVSVIDQPARDGEYFRAFVNRVAMTVIRIDFDSTELPTRCYEFVSRGTGELREIRDLRLSNNEAQSVVTDLPWGIHGVAWEWE
jgi:hypothetical protein